MVKIGKADGDHHLVCTGANDGGAEEDAHLRRVACGQFKHLKVALEIDREKMTRMAG
jgi:hypothetical protein